MGGWYQQASGELFRGFAILQTMSLSMWDVDWVATACFARIRVPMSFSPTPRCRQSTRTAVLNGKLICPGWDGHASDSSPANCRQYSYPCYFE